MLFKSIVENDIYPPWSYGGVTKLAVDELNLLLSTALLLAFHSF